MVITEELKNEIFLQYQRKVLGYIYNKINHRQLAEDLTSEVFMKVYEKLDSFDDSKASLSTWIFTITRNKLTDYYRTRHVFEEVPETLDDGSDIEESLCTKETMEELADALESLDERQRNIIILRYYSGHTLKEIADRLQISYAYVKVLHNKALAEMKLKMH